MKRKGLSLPINTVVILAMAVIVMVAVGAFFVFFFNPDEFEQQKAFSKACPILTNSYNCDPSKIPTITTTYAPQGQRDTVSMDVLCNLLGYTDNTLCAKVCGCQI